MNQPTTVAYEMTTSFINDVVGRRSVKSKIYYTTLDKLLMFHPVYQKVDERKVDDGSPNNFYQVFEFLGYLVESGEPETWFINEQGFEIAIKKKLMFEVGELD
jgi:hypothetical protein